MIRGLPGKAKYQTGVSPSSTPSSLAVILNLPITFNQIWQRFQKSHTKNQQVLCSSNILVLHPHQVMAASQSISMQAPFSQAQLWNCPSCSCFLPRKKRAWDKCNYWQTVYAVGYKTQNYDLVSVIPLLKEAFFFPYSDDQFFFLSNKTEF